MNLRRYLMLGLVTVNGWGGQMGLSADPAAAEENRYLAISARNAFGLRPEFSAPAEPSATVPRAKITPNGIMTIFGRSQVLLKVAAPPVPGQPLPKEQSYILGEGERQDDVEVRKIDLESGAVTVSNHGFIEKLSLAASMAASPAAGGNNVSASSAPPVRPRPATRRYFAAQSESQNQDFLRNIGIVGTPSHFTGPGMSATPPGPEIPYEPPASAQPPNADGSHGSQPSLNPPTANQTLNADAPSQAPPPVNLGGANTAPPALTSQAIVDGGDVPPAAYP